MFNKPNVDRLICSSTSRQLFSQKIFPTCILFFMLKTIWAFEEWCFTDTPAFSSFFLFSQVLSGVWPSHLDLDTGVTDHEMENHCSKMLEFQLQSQNVLSFCLLCWQHGEDFKCLEAGTHPCEKCVSPLLTLPLWFPVMGLADQILEFNPVDDYGGKWNWGQLNHPILPIYFFKSANSIYVCEAEMIALNVYFVSYLCLLSIYVWDCDQCKTS